jgi:hypothetical protein
MADVERVQNCSAISNTFVFLTNLDLKAIQHLYIICFGTAFSYIASISIGIGVE